MAICVNVSLFVCVLMWGVGEMLCGVPEQLIDLDRLYDEGATIQFKLRQQCGKHNNWDSIIETTGFDSQLEISYTILLVLRNRMCTREPSHMYGHVWTTA